MFHGLSAFPLTPMKIGAVDEASFVHLFERLVEAEVDSIGALGSTGNYASECDEHASPGGGEGCWRYSRYHRYQRRVPGCIEHGRRCSEGRDQRGARAGHKTLSEDEVFGLYDAVTRVVGALCVYDNPGTTHFRFTDDCMDVSRNCPTSAP